MAEFPLGLVALVLAGYAAAGSAPVRRLAAYAGGLLVGVVPLLAYNTWAFGSPLTLSYTNALEAPVGSGEPIVGANEEGFYGVGLPDPEIGALAPLLGERPCGRQPDRARRARRPAAALARRAQGRGARVRGRSARAFSRTTPRTTCPGAGRGQALGSSFRRCRSSGSRWPSCCARGPVAVAAIGLVSVAVMALATLTDPLTGEEYGLGTWWEGLRRGELVDTVLTRLGLESAWLAIVPFVALLALACALVLTPLVRSGPRRAEAPLVLGLLGAWVVVAAVAPDLRPAGDAGTAEGTVAVALLALTLGVALLLAARNGWLALLPALPLLALAAPGFDDRPRLALLWVGAVAIVAAAAWARQGATTRAGAGIRPG